ncbi:Membrane protein involved in the export of O-antigen and teichoic acid [Xaviernesmea oryzae]|uniref:Membrane protein involved in the export of O-antigen and teichoic acid n=1 Tax=Xaviernesmea oryzae TaxID=464029 RepID=A0A1X7FG63_9HYPH|nr:hypothetical protein [Xaviernesmea oryzae]SMF51068.1 Membrane protein involved in the export of O-antigen and teichoic acid [Xaviernesmea oryzae]
MLKRITGQVDRKQLINIAMLTGGYGLGQGSLFFSQTWLLVNGDLKLLAFFGTSFAFAVLAVMIVDAGSYIVLARHTVNQLSSEDAWLEIWRCYWETSIFRLVMAAMFAAVTIIFIIIGVDDDAVWFAVWFMPALIIWSFNGTGLIDGLNLSGISGLSGALPYIAAAVALIGCHEFSVERPGGILGAAICLGYAGTVTAQFMTLLVLDRSPRFLCPTKTGIKRSMAQGLQLISSQIPGQLYFRGQLLLSNSFLGADVTALFIYGKQVVNSFIQVIAFIRRAEFPKLVAQLSQTPQDLLRTTFRVQRFGNSLAAAMAIAVLLMGLGLGVYADGETSRAGFVVALFAPTIVTTTVVLAFQQAMSALGKYGALAKCIAAAMLAGTAVAGATINWLGIIGLALADLAQHAVNSWFSVAHLKSLAPTDVRQTEN